MREIKFKAWDKARKEMVDDVRLNGMLNSKFNSDNLVFLQFTGLKDKNVAEIYEGDILNHKKQGLRTVKYGNKHFDYAGFTLENTEGMTNTLQNPHIYEVIGNVYENPELLK